MCLPGQIQSSCDWNTHEIRKFMESGLSLNLASCVIWGSSCGLFSLGVKIQFSTRMWYIPSQIINKFPVTEAQLHQTELCAALKRKRIKNCYSPNTSWDEHDVYLTSGLNSAGSSLLTEQTDLASPSIWWQRMQFTSHMGFFSGNRPTIKCHKKSL